MNSNLFREYIGAQFKNVKFSDVPINPNTNFHFILSFAIDYTNSSTPSPTNGKFDVFWDSDNLSPMDVFSIKQSYPNVKVALSLGGDTVGETDHAYFKPSSKKTWVANAVSSLTKIIKMYHLDGIDVNYEHFKTGSSKFAKCIGKLIMTLKKNNVISFASIAPFDDEKVQRHYMALWERYGDHIDYVNFQFYTYDQQTNVSQFLRYFETQMSNYQGGKIIVGFLTSADGGGLSPENGFFTACKTLKTRNQLHGIFIWSADESKSKGFRYEEESQALLAE